MGQLTKPDETMLRLTNAFVFARSFPGVKGIGPTYDDTAGLNAALEFCYQNNKQLLLGDGDFAVQKGGVGQQGRGYCLLSKGVSILGAGPSRTRIVPFTGGNFGDTESPMVDYLQVAPQQGFFNDFMSFSQFAIWPAFPLFDSGHKGQRGIWLVFNFADINIGKLDVSRLYLFPGNDRSFYMENNPTLLPQGCPSNSHIHDCTFFEGMKASYIGDSNVFERLVLRSRASGAPGFEGWTVVGAFGSAGHNILRDVNIDAYGGGIILRSGRHWVIEDGNVEQSLGVGSPVGAVIHLMGDIGRLKGVRIINTISAIFGTSIAQRALYLGACDDTYLEAIDYDTDSPRDVAIWNSSSSHGLTFGVNVKVTSAWAGKIRNDADPVLYPIKSVTVANGYTL